ncbi:hypothetical protein ACFQZE_09095 [Paenibacillus sp. GCM10027627]|uniref:hypothetical protein n=1 Tax=unclassified Paenibacillus TaxID=185978 RepID=UPI003627DD31
MKENMTAFEAREVLLRLFQDAGYELPELRQYIEKLESNNLLQEEEIRKLKSAAAKRISAASGMNSRLKDALRE